MQRDAVIGDEILTRGGKLDASAGPIDALTCAGVSGTVISAMLGSGVQVT